MADAAVVWQARTLLRDARAATLATAKDGQPFAGLVTPACAPDLGVMMLLSGLSEHTRHLADDPRCAVMVVGEPTEINPQTAPRLTVIGQAIPERDPALKARWVARHPYAAFYAGFADFRLFKLLPSGGHFIGGFASAHRFAAADLIADPAAVAAIAAAEPALIERMNANTAALDAIAGEAGWLAATIDVDGCDLVRGDVVKRIAWSGSAISADAVQAELAHLARR